MLLYCLLFLYCIKFFSFEFTHFIKHDGFSFRSFNFFEVSCFIHFSFLFISFIEHSRLDYIYSLFLSSHTLYGALEVCSFIFLRFTVLLYNILYSVYDVFCAWNWYCIYFYIYGHCRAFLTLQFTLQNKYQNASLKKKKSFKETQMVFNLHTERSFTENRAVLSGKFRAWCEFIILSTCWSFKIGGRSNMRDAWRRKCLKDAKPHVLLTKNNKITEYSTYLRYYRNGVGLHLYLYTDATLA